MALEFCRNRNKNFNVLTETHINHHQIHHIGNNWLVPIVFSTGDRHTKRLLVLLYRHLEGVIDDDTDPKEGLISFKITSSDDGVLCVYSPSRHNTKEQLSKGHFLEGLQNYMENKSDGNENKIIALLIKWTRMVVIKHRLYRCGSNFSLSKDIVGLRTYGEVRTQISTMIHDRPGLY